eukprot:15438254-Alexandrium_andersonii.AAC.1
MSQATSGEELFALAADEYPHQCRRLEELATKVLQRDKLHHYIRPRVRHSRARWITAPEASARAAFFPPFDQK